MNQTNYTILKLLFQQPLSEENLLNYLKINPLTLKKSISQLNHKLKTLQLAEIKVDKNIYSLSLTTVERDFFYNSCIDCSQEQRCSYLILKLLIEKNLNLEVEKDILNISRATIDRDFCYIKKKLLEYKIPISSKKWEGIFLTSDETNYFYELLCEQLIALHYEYNYLPKVLRVYLNKIQGEQTENLIELFFSIYDKYQIQIGEISLNYFLSLKICFKYFPKFHLTRIDEYIESLGKECSYHKIYENLSLEYKLEKSFGRYIAMNLHDTIYKQFYSKKLYSSIISNYCDFFKIKITNEEEYILMLFFHLSELKYRSKIYDVKNIYLKSKYDEDILKKLNLFLKKLDSKLLYGDLLELLDFTKYFILLNKRNEYKKVLILKKEVNLGYFADLEKKLQGVYPNFIFKVKPYAYINLLKNIDLEYDFILSDMNLDINLKYIFCQANISIVYTISELLMEEWLKDF